MNFALREAAVVTGSVAAISGAVVGAVAFQSTYQGDLTAASERAQSNFVELPDASLRHVRRGGGAAGGDGAAAAAALPTTVFVGAHNEAVADWHGVQSRAAGRSLSYARAGLGLSDARGGGGGGARAAAGGRELVDVLRAAGVAGPVVCVAHGLGALYVRAAPWGEDGAPPLAGLVLVDPVVEGVRGRHAAQAPRVAAALEGMEAGARSTAFFAQVGLLRLVLSARGTAGLEQRGYAPAVAELALAEQGSPKHHHAAADELRAWAAWDGGEPPPLPLPPLPEGVPVVVLSHGAPAFEGMAGDTRVAAAMERQWDDAIRDLVGDRGPWFKVTGAAGRLPQARPEAVALAASAVVSLGNGDGSGVEALRRLGTLREQDVEPKR